MTLTQMFPMTPVEKAEVFTQLSASDEENFDVSKGDESISPHFQKGDLIERPHPLLNHFTIFGIVEEAPANNSATVTAYWQYYDYNGMMELTQVCKKKETVFIGVVKLVAAKSENLKLEQFNWWKVKGIQKSFVWRGPNEGWFFDGDVIG